MITANITALLLSSALTSAATGTQAETYPYFELARATAIFMAVLANVSFAGMRAQGSPSTGWKWFSFLIGLPFTIVSFLLVRPGSGMAYGIRLPMK